mmetsp:Transcript_14813/g.31373  ORF Transcript_14813/g.31373 Transcript_14813/m.31373 type:complete len:389 (+) Transcript_14813:138-1304(+)
MSTIARHIIHSHPKQLRRALLSNSSLSKKCNNFTRNYNMAQASSFSSNATDDSTTLTRPPINVAFVGLGNMGLQMALNVAIPKNKDGLPPMHLSVHDLNESNVSNFFRHAEEERLDELMGASGSLTAAADLSSVGESSPDFVITSLPTCEASEAVVSGIVDSLPNENDDTNKKCIFIDTSTISPSISKKLHQLVTSVSPNHDYVDAPVSGGVKGATDATLTFMLGCESSSDTFSNVEPLLHRMGKGVIPCGGAGSGSAVKLCNNAALAAQMIGICEAMNLGDALGVDPTVLANTMNVSTAKCWSSEVNNPHPVAAKAIGSGASANGYEGGFGTALMLKDLNLAVDAGEEEGLALPVAGLSRDLYRMADLHGHRHKDFGVMLEFLKGVK